MPQSPYQVYSAGQPINQGAGNRYIPPTYNYRSQGQGRPPNYSEMDWNNVQSYNLPQQQNNPYQQQYMQGLRDTTSRFGQMPMMPQFGGGPSMTYGGFPSPQRVGRNQYGDLDGTGYAGGSPMFDEVFGPQMPTMPQFGGGIGVPEFMANPEGYQGYFSGGMGGRPQTPNSQGGEQGGMGGWQRMLQDFFSRMSQQQGGGQQKPEWAAVGEGQVKPGQNATGGGNPYDKIGYRG